MTITQDSPAPAPSRVLPEPGMAGEEHREFNGWPVAVVAETGNTVLTVDGTLDAVVMRAGLGAETNSVLALHMLTGPVLALPGDPEEWVFLTQPATPLRVSTLIDLARINVNLVSRGAALPLPPSRTARGAARWIVAPVPGRPLPPWQAVISAARSTSSLCSHW